MWRKKSEKKKERIARQLLEWEDRCHARGLEEELRRLRRAIETSQINAAQEKELAQLLHHAAAGRQQGGVRMEGLMKLYGRMTEKLAEKAKTAPEEKLLCRQRREMLGSIEKLNQEMERVSMQLQEKKNELDSLVQKGTQTAADSHEYRLLRQKVLNLQPQMLAQERQLRLCADSLKRSVHYLTRVEESLQILHMKGFLPQLPKAETAMECAGQSLQYVLETTEAFEAALETSDRVFGSAWQEEKTEPDLFTQLVQKKMQENAQAAQNCVSQAEQEAAAAKTAEKYAQQEHPGADRTSRTPDAVSEPQGQEQGGSAARTAEPAAEPQRQEQSSQTEIRPEGFFESGRENQQVPII